MDSPRGSDAREIFGRLLAPKRDLEPEHNCTLDGCLDIRAATKVVGVGPTQVACIFWRGRSRRGTAACRCPAYEYFGAAMAWSPRTLDVPVQGWRIQGAGPGVSRADGDWSTHVGDVDLGDTWRLTPPTEILLRGTVPAGGAGACTRKHTNCQLNRYMYNTSLDATFLGSPNIGAIPILCSRARTRDMANTRI